mmetsp:Transcript_16603/g.47811  ORF Transcript_16603/g.47811 Transcript_16603/m.47811 type:complete len:314 (-) Transcript_16603:509-1450(-)
MASIVQCLLRNCFEDEDDERGGDGERTSVSALPPRLRSMVRSASGRGGVASALESQRGGYFAPTALDDPHGDEEEGARESSASLGCDSGVGEASSSAGGGGLSEEGESSESRPSASGEEHGGVGMQGLFRRLGFAPHSGQYVRVGGVSPVPSRDDLEETELSHHLGSAAAAAVGSPGSPVHQRRALSNSHHCSPRHTVRDSSRSPLRAASSFDTGEASSSSRDIIPAISLDEVVLPGSDLQKQMSVAMAATLDEQGDECVICLEGFDTTNPRMPTLCGCGENRTYFHLPCLYQWVEQDRNCPSCRKRLRWEEF